MPSEKNDSVGSADSRKNDFVLQGGSRDRGSSSSEDTKSEVEQPLLTLRTSLAVLAVCLIYFAQLVSLVGAGAVSQYTIRLHLKLTSYSKVNPSLVVSTTGPVYPGFRPQ